MYKRIIEGKKAVFFDLDGTLIDSEPLWKQAFTNILKTVHMEWFDHNEIAPGVGVSIKWEYVLEKYKDYAPKNASIKDLTDQTYHEYLRLFRENPIGPRLGFWELAYELKENKQIKICLVTNSPKLIVSEVLNLIGTTEAFDLIVAGDDVKNPKPSPEIYQKAAKTMQLKPEEILVFEDSIPGAAAASSAGMEMIIVWDNKLPKFRYPPTVKLFVPDFDGLAYMLDTDLDEEMKKAAEEMQEESNNTTNVA